MLSYLYAFCFLGLATQATKALWCHTCTDYQEWSDVNGTSAERVNDSSISCRRGEHPSISFLRECENETEVCGQFFYDGYNNGVYRRDAERQCLDPIALGYPEINRCYKATVNPTPILPIGPGTIEFCLCNEDECNPILYTNVTVIQTSDSIVLNIMNIL